jgi:anti-sigma factor ChrR (cupin superfamily)
MTTLAVQQVPVTGFTPTFAAAAAGGDACQPDDRVFLRVKNGSAASINVTVVVPGTEYEQARPDVVVAVAAAGDVLIALPSALQDLTTGLVSWTYSAVTTVTVALVRV